MKLAMWLLDRFGVLERNESLAGDLVEERNAGRSIFWTWGQTVAALTDAIGRDLRCHWLLALRAIATGWVLYFGWGRLVNQFSGGGLAAGAGWRLFQGVLLFTFLVWPAIVGWIVARTHRAHQASMVLVFAASMVTYAAWDLTAHYSQMKSCAQCIPDLWDTNLALNCVAVLLTIVGGLVPRQAKQTGLRTPTL